MLKVIRIKEPSSALVEYGEYVLLNVEFDNERLPAAPFYWRTGDFSGSLVEIGINRKSGAVAKIGLIAFGESKPLCNEGEYLDCISIAGIPVMNVDGWPSDRYKDEVGFLSVMENDLCLLILFSDNETVEFVYESHEVRFGVSSNFDLIWVAIRK